MFLGLTLSLGQQSGVVPVYTGWASYQDTQYTSEAPFALSANTDTILPNNAGSKIETYLPRDLTAMFADGKVLGRQGDSYIITADLFAIPTSAQSTLLEIWFDIGGSVGQLYRRPITFPKGQGQVLQVVTSTFVYTLDTWEANGATPYVRGNGTFEIYTVRHVIGRISRG